MATAAAIKAFPIMVLGYLVYRRLWAAAASTVVVLVAWLLIAPLPFRTPAQALDDVVVWSKGMLFTYNSYGIAQRPFRSYSYKNQSIMALSHRLLRNVPADGEAIVSRRLREAPSGPKSAKGIMPLDPSTDLFIFLKPHAQGSPGSAHSKTALAGDSVPPGAGTADLKGGKEGADRLPRWDDVLEIGEPVFRNAWTVNFLDLSFRSVTLVTLAVIAGLCLFVLAVLPRSKFRTRETDAIEYGIVILLTVMFSPLSFNYAYVWLIYPMTIALYVVLSEPVRDKPHRFRLAWLAAVFLIPALAIPMPLLAQAYGNLFFPALLLLFGLGLMLHRLGRAQAVGAPVVRASLPAIRFAAALAAMSPLWHCLFSGFGQECPTIRARHPARTKSI